jgi:hypothetical protein
MKFSEVCSGTHKIYGGQHGVCWRWQVASGGGGGRARRRARDFTAQPPRSTRDFTAQPPRSTRDFTAHPPRSSRFSSLQSFPRWLSALSSQLSALSVVSRLFTASQFSYIVSSCISSSGGIQLFGYECRSARQPHWQCPTSSNADAQASPRPPAAFFDTSSPAPRAFSRLQGRRRIQLCHARPRLRPASAPPPLRLPQPSQGRGSRRLTETTHHPHVVLSETDF